MRSVFSMHGRKVASYVFALNGDNDPGDPVWRQDVKKGVRFEHVSIYLQCLFTSLLCVGSLNRHWYFVYLCPTGMMTSVWRQDVKKRVRYIYVYIYIYIYIYIYVSTIYIPFLVARCRKRGATNEYIFQKRLYPVAARCQKDGTICIYMYIYINVEYTYVKW